MLARQGDVRLRREQGPMFGAIQDRLRLIADNRDCAVDDREDGGSEGDIGDRYGTRLRVLLYYVGAARRD
jgi:hypothetical protein